MAHVRLTFIVQGRNISMPIATAADVAARSGVCRQTVSAVLAGKTGKVSEATRKRILDAATELKYRPNLNAKSLSGRSTQTIGLLIPVELPAILAAMIARTQKEIHRHGYECFILAPSDATHQQRALGEFCARGVDGVLIYSLHHDFDQSRYPLPAVVVGARKEQFDVNADFAYGFELAYRHLEQHGHRKIAFLSDHCAGNIPKIEVYRKLTGLAPDEPSSRIIETKYDADLAGHVKLLLADGVTAFAGTGDILSGMFINFLERRGIRVPEDAAVTGYDATFLSFCGRRQLSAVVHPSEELAKESVKLLFEKMRSGICGLVATPHLIRPVFFKGESCGCSGYDNDKLNVLFRDVEEFAFPFAGAAADHSEFFDFSRKLPCNT